MACHVELGLLVCFIRNPPSRVHSGRNIVRMQLFPGYTYGLLPLPFIPVNFSDHFGFFRCLWTDTYRGWNGCWFFKETSIYILEEFVAFCKVREFLKSRTGVFNQEFALC